jgi:hypothetical protein
VTRAALAASAAAVLALAPGLAGCGGEARDLFLVQRSGSIPGARLSLRVTDDGRASCNRRPLVDITSAQLIGAREDERDLEGPAERRVRLPPGPGSVLRYAVRLEEGTVRFSDTSPRQPPVFFRVAALTRQIARGPCGLAR